MVHNCYSVYQVSTYYNKNSAFLLFYVTYYLRTMFYYKKFYVCLVKTHLFFNQFLLHGFDSVEF